MKRKQRHKRIRAKVKGTAERPRFCVFRSNQHIYAQLINDTKGQTLVAASDLELKAESKTKTDLSLEVGKRVAEKAQAEGINKVVFDRAGYKYHGRVKAVAEGARQGGLEF